MSKTLLFSRPVMFTLLLLLLSTGTYTYSEGNPSPLSIHQKFFHYPVHLTFSSVRNGLSGIVPVDFYWASRLKTTEIAPSLPSEQIMGFGSSKISRLETFLCQNNKYIAKEEAHKLARLYWEESRFEGVNPDVAFAQMCLETGFLRFDGTVDPEQHNYCGLGVTGNGVKGLFFSSQREGVRAHIQHLKAYASTDDLNSDIVDSRFRYVKRGSAEEITDLTGKWATDTHYDKKIRSLLHRLYQVN